MLPERYDVTGCIIAAPDWNGMFAAPLNAVDVAMVAIWPLGPDWWRSTPSWRRAAAAVSSRAKQRTNLGLWRDDPLNSFARHRAPDRTHPVAIPGAFRFLQPARQLRSPERRMRRAHFGSIHVENANGRSNFDQAT